MKTQKLFTTLVCFILVHITLAQTKTIKGVVSDSAGPLPGVAIIIKNTTTGTETDFDGQYSIEAKSGDILVFSFVGMSTQEITVSEKSTINVTLKEDSAVLDEVVVTAQGIKKEKKALGYAISTLKSKEIENKPEADVSRALQGKVAGVQINAASGSSGEPTNITIRGSLSINGENSPLIVVNNVPFSGNLLDIDPNNIESINVLKGLNASVLYGSEGRNGVILIQTKNGSSKLEEQKLSISASQTTYVNTVSGLPDYQNKYGQGSDFNFVGGNLGTWGPRFDSLDFVLHPYSGKTEFPEYNGLMIPYKAAKNNVRNFFRDGVGSTTSLNITTSQKSTRLNFSVGYTDEEGIIGNNDFKRLNIGVGGASQISEKLKISTTLNYSTRKRNSYDEKELFDLLFYIPRNIDVFNLPYQDSQGRNVYYRSSLNPNWLINNTNKNDNVTRVYGTFNGTYTFNDNINATYRIGYVNENNAEFDYSNKGGIDDFEFGFLNIGNTKKVVVDQTAMINANYKLSEKIGLDAQAGVNGKLTNISESNSLNSNQIVYGFLRPSNFSFQQNKYKEIEENLAGAFAQLGFSYDNFLYLNLSGRNDWGSTVEPENRQLFYPGVSVSFIPTSAFNFDTKAIRYLKLRGAYATSSGYPDAYSTRTILTTNPIRFVSPDYGSIITNSSDRFLANPNLKPELHKEVEIGIESKLFNNRVSLDASVYKRISNNQILLTDLSRDVGFKETLINAGRIDTRGVEVDLGIDIIKKEGFNWNFRNLFNAYESEVISLPTGDVSLGGRKRAIEGQPFGVILGDYVMRDEQGNYLINPNNGHIITSDEVGLNDKVIGDPNPDWQLTNINTFTYKDFTLSAQIEYTHGGESYSDLADDLIRRGVTKDTENREGTFVIPGVYGDPSTGEPYLDANGNTIQNTIQLNGGDIAFNHFYNADDLATFDTSLFRIREIAFGYNLTKKRFKKLPFETLALTLSGRNIFYKAPGFPKYTNIDPELDTSDDETRTPTTSRYSLSLAFTF
ncbi:SusC/RagA family TonB-linked outer membrane protein [Tenacibaculum sp. UWU-22]|uniref:SusC/RagA family TonB-linked outer membrane protein n=1 Tax=Tenacibaculum sp. UWU-22 TaxID=3234187 RepID=UPI0034DAF6D1